MFSFLYDSGKIKCLVGGGVLVRDVKNAIGDVEQYNVEQVMSQSSDWIEQRQFLTVISNVNIKQKVVSFLNQHDANYFSLINQQNNIQSTANIGRGVYINYANDFLCNPKIGNHCIVTAYCQFGHDVVVNDFCHISAYTYLNKTELGVGNILGLRTNILGKTKISTADYCNFIINSVVSNDVDESGTYFGNRKLSNQSSLEHQIL